MVKSNAVTKASNKNNKKINAILKTTNMNSLYWQDRTLKISWCCTKKSLRTAFLQPEAAVNVYSKLGMFAVRLIWKSHDSHTFSHASYGYRSPKEIGLLLNMDNSTLVLALIGARAITGSSTLSQ